MVDPISVSALTALFSEIFDGTTDKAGEQLWDSLGSVVRRMFGRRSTSVEAVKRLGERPGDQNAIKALAQALVDDARRDPQAAARLRHWVAAAERTISADRRMSNAISGDVAGKMVRTRDVRRNVTL